MTPDEFYDAVTNARSGWWKSKKGHDNYRKLIIAAVKSALPHQLQALHNFILHERKSAPTPAELQDLIRGLRATTTSSGVATSDSVKDARPVFDWLHGRGFAEAFKYVDHDDRLWILRFIDCERMRTANWGNEVYEMLLLQPSAIAMLRELAERGRRDPRCIDRQGGFKPVGEATDWHIKWHQYYRPKLYEENGAQIEFDPRACAEKNV